MNIQYYVDTSRPGMAAMCWDDGTQVPCLVTDVIIHAANDYRCRTAPLGQLTLMTIHRRPPLACMNGRPC